MNFASFERAQVAAFAYRIARRSGSIDCIRAVCYVLRNRNRAGWGDGNWLSIMEGHKHVAGNVETEPEIALDPNDRLLQLIVRDVDDIYLGNSMDDTRGVVQDALYFQFIDLPATEWFVENIVRDPANHARIAQVGPIAFFK
jgi:hypothetical protein